MCFCCENRATFLIVMQISMVAATPHLFRFWSRLYICMFPSSLCILDDLFKYILVNVVGVLSFRKSVRDNFILVFGSHQVGSLIFFR